MPLNRPTRRTLATLALFLLAGVVVNVAVAWGLALTAPMTGRENPEALIGLDARGEYAWPWIARGAARRIPLVEAGPPLVPYEFRATGFLLRNYGEMPPTGDFDPDFRIRWKVVVVRSGFPLASLVGAAGSFVANDTEDPQNASLVLVEPTTTRLRWLRPIWRRNFGQPPTTLGVSLPLVPLPVGFTVNTLLYSAIVYAPFGLLGLAIRSRRRARGLCPRCKYAIANLPTCPECGETIGRKAATP